MLISAISQGQLPLIIILGVLVVGLGIWSILLYTKKPHAKATEKATQAPVASQPQAEPFKPEIPPQNNQPKVVLGEAPVQVAATTVAPVVEQPEVAPVVEQPVETEIAPVVEVVEPIVETPAEPIVEAPVQPTVEQPATVVPNNTQKRGVVILDGNQIPVRYNRSFTSKLMLAEEQTKGYYAELSNHILSYEKVKNKISWNCSTFRKGRSKLAILNVKGKTLYLYLAVDLATAQPLVKCKLKDVSNKKRYASVPTMVKVKSKRGAKYAKALIELTMQQAGIAFKAQSSAVSAEQFPVDTMDNLIANNLIKVYTLDGKRLDAHSHLHVASFAQVESVTATDAHSLVSDEEAQSLVQEVTVTHTGSSGGRKFAINIDTLSDNFENGDVVNIEVLKQKGLVPEREKAIKVLARGTLDKALTVEANAYSIDAVKMIILTGGKAIKIK